MKKISVVALLLVSLSMPAMAAPRGDDSPVRGNPIMRAVKHIVSVVFDDWDLTWPKP
ncbi:MAG TPA: hypothetical protein VJZ76_00240 [Thermoanaerobaculia bacterium]|nr:hypothetical protein [Thermoanaerobaculia bacterium]